MDQLQNFLMEKVYLSKENTKRARRSRRIISELFELYVQDNSALPERYRSRIDTEGGETAQRVTCDYIAGMTDRFCIQEHERIC